METFAGELRLLPFVITDMIAAREYEDAITAGHVAPAVQVHAYRRNYVHHIMGTHGGSADATLRRSGVAVQDLDPPHEAVDRISLTLAEVLS
jgi:hypothetical protein